MRISILLLALGLSMAAIGQAPTPARPVTPMPRLTARDSRTLPFCREFMEQKFKANDREVPEELRVSIGAAGIHLSGKKRGEVGRVQGRPIGHVGKVVLLPPGERAGRLSVKAASVEGVTYYFAVLELAQALESKPIKLAVGKSYDWTVKTENGQTTLKVLDAGTEVAAVTAPTESVKGAGFAATVRNKGNEADLTIALP